MLFARPLQILMHLEFGLLPNSDLLPNFNRDQKKVIDRESGLILRKSKETIHSLKNPSSEIWLSNLQ